MAKPLVSVIIPTRNRSGCLPHALDSVNEQEGRGDVFDLEIVVADDASSDATPAVIRSYPQARYIRLDEPRGVSAATNVAIRASSGCYIAFLDDDDVWLKHKLRVQIPLLNANPDVGVLYSQSLVRCEGTEELYPDARKAPSGRVFLQMLMDNFAGHHASHLIRRTAFEEAGYFDEALMSNVDYDMSLRLAFHVRFLFVPGAVDVYNLSARGLWLTRAASGAGRADAAQVIENALRLLPDSPENEEIRRRARARVMLDAVYPLLFAADLVQARAAVETALRAHPWVLRHDWARHTLGHVAAKLALSTTTPLSTVHKFCTEISSTALNRAIRDRWYVRSAIGTIWAGAALSLASGGPGHDRESACAATVAIAAMPSLMRHPGLLRLIVRGVLGRRAEAVCTEWYMRMRKGAVRRPAGAPDPR
jgi:glycosyltransferase involved in cell wall biosynthesis